MELLDLMSNGSMLYILDLYKYVDCVNFLCIHGTLIFDNNCLVLYPCSLQELRLFLIK